MTLALMKTILRVPTKPQPLRVQLGSFEFETYDVRVQQAIRRKAGGAINGGTR